MSRRSNTRNRNRSAKKVDKKVIFTILILLLFLLFISVIFSLINMGNNKIINRVYIGDINISNLSQEEAKEKIETWYKETALSNIELTYNELSENITIEQFDSTINSDELIKKACKIGKSGNIIKDNYEILFTLLFKNKIELNIQLNNEKIDKKIEEINSKLPDALQKSNYYIEEDNLIIKKGKKGIQINSEELKKQLNEVIKKEENRKIIIPVNEITPEEIDIEKIYNEIKKDAQNAYISQEPLEVHSHVNGVDFAISLEEAKNILEEQKEEYVIPLKITIPEITLNDLGKEAFPQILGTFSTTYNTSNQNRITNLKLASEKIDGTIILPGETFSYNKVVGERTIAKGYKEAAVYAGGKVVDGIGGGICQLSSTLYNSVLYANLEITSRSNHRFLTSYVTAGRDATVSWGTIDFCFKNTRSYPIKITSEVKNGVVTTSIYGIKEEKEYEVVIESKVIEVIPYSTKYVKDSTLKEDEEEIAQYGANGAKSETYKIVKYNGIVVSREQISSDIYSPLERIVKRGTKKAQEVIVMDSSSEEKINPDLLKQIKELN
mgnify:FL=1